MATPFLRPVLRGALAQIRHVTPVRPADARSEVAGVYAEVEREFGMLAPPVALHAASPPVLAASWVMLRETLVAAGRVDRAAKEEVAAAVSEANSCPYCAAVHGATWAALIGDGEPRRPVGGLGEHGGWRPATDAAAPFPAEQAPELVGVAVTFHYLNRMVSVFLQEDLVPPGAPAAVRRAVTAVLGRRLRHYARSAPAAGGSLDLLASAALPADLAWAAGTPSIAGAFARAASVIDAAGARSVPEPVRDLVRAELAQWDGSSPGLGRDWLEKAVSGLPEEQRPAGRLALLTAKAAYRVDEGLVAQYRLGQPGDAGLVELTAWAALTAAREVGSRLGGARAPSGVS
ncbi:carboxymuconolactone decarboxylase family protein [Streptomyces sp. FH025]|uniref:carboxymuconolactone decarboxylase family protein n=1 Tax=Streptomyces sp. FH025 TaxID=2815937 RepID=UPI001A9F88B0|nr:carboxymuconolactone decarboxylase family protein [Streptomyces sp. FH025]MBO1413342.1 carboxymuconolactone decarboxylase family protein [Streptomyces sp. FH025]